MNKRVKLLLMFCLFSMAVKAQETTYKLSPKTVICGGFAVGTPIENKSLGDSIIIYGKVTDCVSKDKVYALIGFFDKRSQRVDTVYSDKDGNYRKKILNGTYKLRAIAPKYGAIDTVYIDFDPQTMTQVDLYLSDGPRLID